jgi:hypothetical protein
MLQCEEDSSVASWTTSLEESEFETFNSDLVEECIKGKDCMTTNSTYASSSGCSLSSSMRTG